MKKFTLGIILGLFLTGTVVCATNYLYHSNEVSYTPEDTTWNVSNIQQALNDLHSKANDSGGAVYLGEYGSETTIDVSNLGADNVNQFIAVSSTAKTHSAPSTSSNGDVKNYYGMGWINTYGYYTPATMTLNESTLSLVPAKIGASASSNHASASRSDSYLNTKVYFVKNVKTN